MIDVESKLNITNEFLDYLYNQYKDEKDINTRIKNYDKYLSLDFNLNKIIDISNDLILINNEELDKATYKNYINLVHLLINNIYPRIINKDNEAIFDISSAYISLCDIYDKYILSNAVDYRFIKDYITDLESSLAEYDLTKEHLDFVRLDNIVVEFENMIRSGYNSLTEDNRFLYYSPNHGFDVFYLSIYDEYFIKDFFKDIHVYNFIVNTYARLLKENKDNDIKKELKDKQSKYLKILSEYVTKYWEMHEEEYNRYVNNLRISEDKILKYRDEVNEISALIRNYEKQLETKVPKEKELDALLKEIEEKEETRKKTFFLRFKKRKQLKIEIEELNNKVEVVKLEINKERARYKEAIRDLKNRLDEKNDLINDENKKLNRIKKILETGNHEVIYHE